MRATRGSLLTLTPQQARENITSAETPWHALSVGCHRFGDKRAPIPNRNLMLHLSTYRKLLFKPEFVFKMITNLKWTDRSRVLEPPLETRGVLHVRTKRAFNGVR